jgi:hypothetical protein
MLPDCLLGGGFVSSGIHVLTFPRNLLPLSIGMVLIETACSTVWQNTRCDIPQETTLPNLKSHVSIYSYLLLIRPWQVTNDQIVAFSLHVWEIQFWIFGIARNTF